MLHNNENRKFTVVRSYKFPLKYYNNIHKNIIYQSIYLHMVNKINGKW